MAIWGTNYDIVLYLPLNHRNSYTMFRIFVSLVKYHFLVVSTCTVFALVGYQFYYCEATVVKLMKFKTYCMNNQQVCIHVCQHILLFTVQHYLYCVHFYNVIF